MLPSFPWPNQQVLLLPWYEGTCGGSINCVLSAEEATTVCSYAGLRWTLQLCLGGHVVCHISSNICHVLYVACRAAMPGVAEPPAGVGKEAERLLSCTLASTGASVATPVALAAAAQGSAKAISSMISTCGLS